MIKDKNSLLLLRCESCHQPTCDVFTAAEKITVCSALQLALESHPNRALFGTVNTRFTVLMPQHLWTVPAQVLWPFQV